MPNISAEDLAELVRDNQLHDFSQLLSTIYSCRFTGAVTFKFLCGEPQEAEFGRPHVVVFPRPGTKPLDSTP